MSERVSPVRDCMFIVWLLWFMCYTEFRIYWQHIEVYTAVQNAYIAIGLRFFSPFVSLALTRPVADSMNNSKVCRTLLAARHPNGIQWNKRKNIIWLINQRQIKFKAFEIRSICCHWFVAVVIDFDFVFLSFIKQNIMHSNSIEMNRSVCVQEWEKERERGTRRNIWKVNFQVSLCVRVCLLCALELVVENFN